MHYGLSPDMIWPNKRFLEKRSELLSLIMAHRKARRVEVGSLVSVAFESRFSLWWQVQEMLRIENAATEAQIDEELIAYRPLVPGQGEWVVTMFIEAYPQPYRQQVLRYLSHIEKHLWLSVENILVHGQVIAQDSGTRDDGKTAAVHFIRFPLENVQQQLQDLNKAQVILRIDHPRYHHYTILNPSLTEDLIQELTHGTLLPHEHLA